MIAFSLPFPPSFNHAWRRVGNVTVLSKSQRVYRAAAKLAIAMERGYGKPLHGIETMTGRLAVALHFFPGDARKWDLDGKPKAVLDVIAKAGVFADDEQIDCLMLYRGGIDRDNPRVDVRIWIYAESEKELM